MGTITTAMAAVEHRLGRMAAARGWYPPLHVRGGPGAGLRVSLRQASADYTLGTNELPVQQAVVDALRRGDVFFDIGANVGFFALLAARRVGPQGRVVAFEPVPANVECIARNARANRFTQITTVPAAAAAVRGEVELLLSGHPGGATTSVADEPSDLTGRIVVPTVAIDDLVAAGEVPTPDVVKIDVEGAELAVLDGMRRTLAEARPTLVCEFDSGDEDGVQRKLATARGVLADAGYTLTELPRSYTDSGWQVVHVVAAPTTSAA